MSGTHASSENWLSSSSDLDSSRWTDIRYRHGDPSAGKRQRHVRLAESYSHLDSAVRSVRFVKELSVADVRVEVGHLGSEEMWEHVSRG